MNLIGALAILLRQCCGVGRRLSAASPQLVGDRVRRAESRGSPQAISRTENGAPNEPRNITARFDN